MDGPHFIVTAAGAADREVALEGEIVTLGRDPASSLLLEGGHVSRQHARMERVPEGFTIADAGSRNGTLVNGERIENARVLRSGDRVAIGEFTLRYVDGPDDGMDMTMAITAPVASPLRCDPETRQVLLNGKPIEISLSVQEFDLLAAMCAQYGRICTRDALGVMIWGAGNFEYNMLHRLVHRLKGKLDVAAPGAIASIAGVGYRLTLVEYGSAPPAEAAAVAPVAGPSAVAAPTGHGTAIILFADIADSTATTERIGDESFRNQARALDDALRVDVRDCGGRPVEGRLLGDGILAVFTSARQAIEAALRCAVTGDDSGLRLHVGLHAGDVIHEDGNVFGGAVNIASRVSALAAPGEVVVSGTVRDLARTSAGVEFVDHGTHTLKGVGEPVATWRAVARRGD